VSTFRAYTLCSSQSLRLVTIQGYCLRMFVSWAFFVTIVGSVPNHILTHLTCFFPIPPPVHATSTPPFFPPRFPTFFQPDQALPSFVCRWCFANLICQDTPHTDRSPYSGAPSSSPVTVRGLPLAFLPPPTKCRLLQSFLVSAS